MHRGILGIGHGGRARFAIAFKLAAVLATVALLASANTRFSLGTAVLLIHAGLLAIIAGLFIWRVAHRSMATKVRKTVTEEERVPHVGIKLHSAIRYDVLAWFFTLGRERAFREKILKFAKLRSGESVLDAGCGTGTIAVLAKKIVGVEGRVEGIDASDEMIERATAKARRAGFQIGFSIATAQRLPFRQAEFDVVLGTLMVHHLPKRGREEFGREAFRVLRPGGRLLLVDFAKPIRRKSAFRLHKHGHVDMDRVAADLGQCGFRIGELGEVGTKGLRYLIAYSDPRANAK